MSEIKIGRMVMGVCQTNCYFLYRQGERLAVMQRQVNAWAMYRNSACSTVRWRFSSDDARCKLRKLYPVIF